MGNERRSLDQGFEAAIRERTLHQNQSLLKRQARVPKARARLGFSQNPINSNTIPAGRGALHERAR